MGIFISVAKTCECVIIALLLAIALLSSAYKSAGVLQSAGYSNRKFIKWIRRKDNHMLERHLILALLCLLSSVITSLCFSFAGSYSAVIGLVPSAVLYIAYFFADRKLALRSEAAFTPRFKRLGVILYLVFAIFSYILVTLLNFAAEAWGNDYFDYLRYCALAVMPALILPLIMLANLIAKIYEIPHNGKFIKSAKASLSKSDIKVVGITGSYGKTSTKFILNSILSKKFKVLTTPRSHNTPIGIALAVNNADLSEYDIFIAEMGARHVGDITELCEICPPDISVITGVCGQHLESFSTFENIVKAKSEILTYTKNKAIIAEDFFELFAETPCVKESAHSVSDIVATRAGTEFKLTLGGESRTVKCKLLGEHSAYNIGLAAIAAYELGMTIDEIASAIGELEYIEHRLQLIDANGVHILDDGYNSNVKGARAALKVLSYFDERRIVVTCGLVELGVLEGEENYRLGKELVGLNFVILVGDTLIKPVKDGYLENGGDKEKLVVVPTLAAAQEELKKYISAGDTVLFLNDLPDVI